MIYFFPAQSRVDYNALAADGPVGSVPLSLRTWLWSSPAGGEQQFLAFHPPWGGKQAKINKKHKAWGGKEICEQWWEKSLPDWNVSGLEPPLAWEKVVFLRSGKHRSPRAGHPSLSVSSSSICLDMGKTMFMSDHRCDSAETSLPLFGIFVPNEGRKESSKGKGSIK